MNNIEEYQNLVSVIKHALEFYANAENYEINVPKNNVLFAYIDMDKGAQARFALSKIEEVENNQKEFEKQFAELSDAFSENNSMKDTFKIIEEYKKVAENGDKI